MTDAKIMIVENDASSAAHLEECLKNLGYTVCAAVSCGRQAIKKAADRHPDLALINLCLEGEITGPEVAEQMGNQFAVPVLYLTDEAEGDLLQQAQTTNSSGYVLRPFEERQLHLNIQTALAMHERESRHKETEISLKQTINKLEDVTHLIHLLEAVFNSMHEGVVAFDEKGGLLFYNSSAGRIAGEPPESEEIDIYKWFEIYGVYHPDEKTPFPVDEGPLGIALKGETTDEVEVFLRNKFKSEGVHIRVSSRPLLRETGVLKGAILVFRDITKEIEAEQMKAELLRLRTELETTSLFPSLIGTSPVMQDIYKLMDQAAESDITVFISGESGTGKELVANSLHANSTRKDEPFVALDCAAIPETLIESELFGHERGAFTGATTQRIGAFERANGGTLFLDEIGDMPYVMQGKLLRVLQERKIQRIGGTAPIPIDIRVITATNKDLEHAIKAGKFRQDLFYRIAAFPILVPPLRERREDIPLLVRHFLEKYTAKTDKSISDISTFALRLLLQYSWPGNVRELENAIARAVLLETTGELQADNLPSQLSPVIALGRDLSAPQATLPLTEIERQALIHAIEATDNNMTQAAQALGINRTTLYRKLKQYNIVRG